MLSIVVAVLALAQAPSLVKADEDCSNLYATLRIATGDTLAEAVRSGNLYCLGDLAWVSDAPLQIAVSMESNVVTVANSIPEAMAVYTGSRNDGIKQLFLYLRMARDIHRWCLTKRSCDGDEWNNAETYSINVGSPVHTAVKAAIDSFAQHPLFHHASSKHADNVWEVGRTIIDYEMGELYLSVVASWLNAWDDSHAAIPIFHDAMGVVLDVVYWGHRQASFGPVFGENRDLVHAFRDFALDERWLGTSSQWIMQRAAIELGRYSKYKDATNYRYVLPIVQSVITTYRNRPEAKAIWLRLVGEIHYNDSGNCERYGLCDWYTGDGFNANFRAALFTETLACPVNACSGDSVTVHAQALGQDKLATACQRLYEEGQAFQTLFDTRCTPVVDDLNHYLDVYVFNDGGSCEEMESAAFGRNVDTCSGIYYEHDPSNPNSSAQVVVTEYTADENPRDPELAIWNFEHEYAHYLDGRYNRHGPYRGHDPSTHWWTEGFAEYLAAEVSPYIDSPARESPYSLTDTLLHSGSIPTRYRHRHLAVRFLMANHRDFVDTLLEYMRQGDYAAYTAHMAAEAPKLEDEWQAWLAGVEGSKGCEADLYCCSEPAHNQHGYIASVVLGSLNHADDVNLGYRLYDKTVTVQVGSAVELRVTASKKDPGTEDVNRVQAWIDWNGDGRFDESTEQVMDAEVLLTNQNNPVTVSATLTVPSDAHIGTVRMRVRVQHKTNEGRGVCGNYESGETEDYAITLTADPNPNNQPTTGGAFVPVILSSAGSNNAFFTSELTLTNRGDQQATLNYTYTAAAGGGTGTASDVLAPGQQKIVPDAIGYLKSLGIPIPDAGNRIGTLRVDFSGSVGVLARTTTAVPDGRAGLAYPGIPSDAGFEEAVYLCGLRQNKQDRSNVAFQNMGASAEGNITLRTTVFSGDPAALSSRVLPEVTLAPGGFHQYSGVLGSVANGFVKVERVDGTRAFYAYGVINDQANSDGSFVFPATESSLVGTSGQTLPVIVETGVFNSELTVTNFSEVAKTIRFSFVADAVETADHTAKFSLTLEAGEQRIIPNVVDELRRQGVEGIGSAGRVFAGAVFATADSGDMSGIVIGARTGSPGGGGQYSVSYNAVPYGSSSFTDSAWIDALQQNAENRSNLALVNTGEVDGSDSVFSLDIYDGETGMLVNTVSGITVPAKRWHQINGLLGKYTQGTTQGYIQIKKLSGANPFLAYGVVNDGAAPGQRSGDGAYVPARE